jgi:hypothetical protein
VNCGGTEKDNAARRNKNKRNKNTKETKEKISAIASPSSCVVSFCPFTLH